MVHSRLNIVGFFKDCFKSFVLGFAMLFVSLCIIYRCDKLALTAALPIFTIYILPQKSLLLVLIHRFILIRKRIKLSSCIIICSFSIWLISYFLTFFYLDSFLQEISYSLFGRTEIKINGIWICDADTTIADLAMITALIIQVLPFDNWKDRNHGGQFEVKPNCTSEPTDPVI